eukprot:gene38780-50967_t
MVYFLVERHRRAFHLLSSGEFKTAGSNLVRTEGKMHFSGNMWWATATYLGQLRLLDWAEGKYAGENWLLGNMLHSYSRRVYEFHDSHTTYHYYKQRYFRSSYATS